MIDVPDVSPGPRRELARHVAAPFPRKQSRGRSAEVCRCCRPGRVPCHRLSRSDSRSLAAGLPAGPRAGRPIPSLPRRSVLFRRCARAWPESLASQVLGPGGAMRICEAIWTCRATGSSCRSHHCPWLDGAANRTTTGADRPTCNVYHEVNPSAKADPMAGTTTSLPRWALPCALLVVLLATFGVMAP